jgi:hypothetical protein
MQGVANIVLGTATLCFKPLNKPFGTSQYIPCWCFPEWSLQRRWDSLKKFNESTLQITNCDSPHQQMQEVSNFYQLYTESATLCFLLKNIRRRRFGDSPHRWYMGVNFLFRISPRIRIQNQKGYSNSVGNLCWTNLYFKSKNPSVPLSHEKETTGYTHAGKGLCYCLFYSVSVEVILFGTAPIPSAHSSLDGLSLILHPKKGAYLLSKEIWLSY